MLETVMTIFFGVLLCVLGIINMTGNVSSLHSYHTKRVREEDKKPFGRLVGSGTLAVGASIVANSVLTLISEKAQVSLYSLIGTVVLIAGVVCGLILIFFGMIKYNKGIF